MKSYPKIEHYNQIPFGLDCYAFYKHDGSNFRAEWGRKRGWYKYGSKNVMIDKNTPILGESIDVFLNKYGESLDSLFRNRYKKIENFVIFGEFFGTNSFAGQHIEEDKKDIVLFDVNQYKRGFIPPEEFVDNFGHLGIPKIVYKGKYNEELVSKVRKNELSLEEGVICKGVVRTKKDGNLVWMSKIKCNHWLEKVHKLYGDKAMIEEFNGDRNIMNYYLYK